MARLVVLNIFMFLLPFAVYVGYAYLAHRVRDADTFWEEAPIGWLVAAGFVMVLIGITILISFSGGAPTGDYVPPVYEDGVIRPGRVE